MNSIEASHLRGFLTIGLTISFAIIYLVAKLLSVGFARFTKRKLISHRLFGVFAVVVAAYCASWQLYRLLFVQEVYDLLTPPDRKYEYLFDIIFIPLFPALFVICITSIRGYLAARRISASNQTIH